VWVKFTNRVNLLKIYKSANVTDSVLCKCAFLPATAELTKYLLEKRCQGKNYKEKRNRNIVSNIFPGNFAPFEAIRERWRCA
jgi:hypothetical protein